MGKRRKKTYIKPSEEALERGIILHRQHPLFSRLKDNIVKTTNEYMGKDCAALTKSDGTIYLNKDFMLSPENWAYAIAHSQLHLAFGHFDALRLPGYDIESETGKTEHRPAFDKYLWNTACDIYIAKFLQDIKFGKPLCPVPITTFPGSLTDEGRIYDYLKEHPEQIKKQYYGTGTDIDMIGLENPVTYDTGKKQKNEFAAVFAYALASSVSTVVGQAGGHDSRTDKPLTPSDKAAGWFINHYPLLGGLAAAFKIIEDYTICSKNEIQIAAIDVTLGEIYINPAAGLSGEELKFVLAHEYLHSGLMHHSRCQGRHHELWNVACDYVINSWLIEMQIGTMPENGPMYDERLKGMSAEEIYDKMVTDLKKYSKHPTFRGYGKGDILTGLPKEYDYTDNRLSRPYDFPTKGKGYTDLDDFYREALSQGLEYHTSTGRGYIPAGLIAEIRALSVPPIPWDVELARWFDCHFAPLEKKRTYARPSRRQGTTPDIPRPRYIFDELNADSRTFGVVVDTSGSMSSKLLGMALGAIASYAAAKEVPLARVVFCDAAPYDAGYLSPDDIAGRVEVKGRGGTILQPGVDLLERAKDFPKNGPILIITDGEIENHMNIHREHAFLVPRGKRLPFKARGPVFYFKE